MNLRDLQYLVALAREQHFGRAAEQCFVSQPTLSTQIRKLEEELGITLVERGGGKVMLTRSGEQVVARARVVLRDVEELKSTARAARDPASGSLRLGAFPTLAPFLLPRVVPQLRQAYPDLELLLFEFETEKLLGMLADGELDAALLAQPEEHTWIDQVALFREPFYLAVPEGHELEGDEPVSLEALTGANLMLLREGHCMRDQALAVCEIAGATERQGFRATSLETLRQMVAAGGGVTLLPALAVKSTPTSIVMREFQRNDIARDIALFWRKSSARSQFLRELAPCLIPANEPDLTRLDDA